ncbi:methyl-accepting chemotaxis protein [Phenylobacterium sp. 20VBR1]|uniref:Methyl-accepting chemotaxis protein n=1 Tax=Phenylobacterium glaciei TaxID=2803784 RepID=A0A941CYR1_9CAUL|nr:methyl-accepting chemotaxis protein [Phenylobacterium glaciei]MBR7617979.1 methyl-accepting chemotaxis protein [Phenylobacterium glaciei]
MKTFRLADLSLVVKMAFAPAFAVLMLALVAGGAVWSQQQQSRAIDRIVSQDMAVSLDLARISKRITAVHGDLYLLMTHTAATPGTDPTAQLQKLMTDVDSIKADLGKLKGKMPPAEQKRFDSLIKDLTDYRGGIEVVGSMLGIDFATAAAFVEPFEVQYNRMTETLDGATALVQKEAKAHAKASADEAAMTGKLAMGGALITLLAVAGISIATILGVKRAIQGIAGATEKLAAGDNQQDLDKIARGDELGAIVGSLGVFRDNQLRLTAMREEQEAMATREQATRAQAEKERADTQAAQAAVVSTLADGLSRLSQGDLTHSINQAFPEEYEALRSDFNAAVDKLREAMQVIVATSSQIGSSSEEIAGASDDLSRRTEQQAASLEETAAALDEITATVKKSAEGASHARAVVQTAKTGAADGGDIVRQAVLAMGEIEKSSTQISQIIGVIDEIAFQTNLLALNAGVEAARAGEAGKGFAVVASEVRALAQRSAEAAKEIKALISASSTQVGSGVQLVGKTGQALEMLVAQVDEIDGLVGEIAASAKEQAVGLNEVNAAVNKMDQVTQQNAAMVEQSTAAAHALNGEATELRRLMGDFRTGAESAPPRASRPQAAGPGSRPAASPPRRMAEKIRANFGGAAATQHKTQDWEEF